MPQKRSARAKAKPAKQIIDRQFSKAKKSQMRIKQKAKAALGSSMTKVEGATLKKSQMRIKQGTKEITRMKKEIARLKKKTQLRNANTLPKKPLRTKP